MIVKNEELTLGRILQCAKKFADEIVVVDTGSGDKSKQIALSFTDKVYDFAWCDNFSAARNYAFSKGTCDFLMWLDADDFITEENIKKLNELKRSDINADVFMCIYKYASMRYQRERLLKRSKNFKWQGFVHEVIVPSGKIVNTDIEIEHHKEHEYDTARNLKLYQKALKNGAKFSAREQYYYARELFYNNKLKKAITEFKKFIKMKNAYAPDVLGASIMLSEAQIKCGFMADALQTLFNAMRICTPTAELCCRIAYIYDASHLPESAIFWFKAALCAPEQKLGFVVPDYHELIPCIELSRLLFFTNFSEAKKYHLMAKKIAPQNACVQFNEQFFSENIT